MKITKLQFKQVIKEELKAVLSEAEEDYYGETEDISDDPRKLRWVVKERSKMAQKALNKVNLYLKNAQAEGKNHEFISKMLRGAFFDAASVMRQLKYAYRLEARLGEMMKKRSK